MRSLLTLHTVAPIIAVLLKQGQDEIVASVEWLSMLDTCDLDLVGSSRRNQNIAVIIPRMTTVTVTANANDTPTIAAAAVASPPFLRAARCWMLRAT